MPGGRIGGPGGWTPCVWPGRPAWPLLDDRICRGRPAPGGGLRSVPSCRHWARWAAEPPAGPARRRSRPEGQGPPGAPRRGWGPAGRAWATVRGRRPSYFSFTATGPKGCTAPSWLLGLPAARGRKSASQGAPFARFRREVSRHPVNVGPPLSPPICNDTLHEIVTTLSTPTSTMPG